MEQKPHRWLTAVACAAAKSHSDQWTDCVERLYVFCSGPLITRLLYVGNLPTGIAEETVKDCFPDALRAIVPSKDKEDSSMKSGG